MAAQVDDRAWVQAMLDFEAALAAALADAGLAPREAADEIAAQCRAEKVDLAELGRGTAEQGTPVPALRSESSFPLAARYRVACTEGA